jgi:hypothetical protein
MAEEWVPELKKLGALSSKGQAPVAPVVAGTKRANPYISYSDPQLFVKRPNLLVGGRKIRKTRRYTRRKFI